MLWYPYTQMRNIKTIPQLINAKGVQLYLANGNVLIDGIASWWSAIHGYNHPELNEALHTQIEKFSHIMLGGMTHAPALSLAENLVRITPKGLNHVFFSDSGSIGVEVALKISLQYWKNKDVTSKSKIVYLKNGYHGDTFKAMEVSDDSDFNRAFSDVLSPQISLEIPSGGFHASSSEIQSAIASMEETFSIHHESIACFILEPIVQCAGGFNIYSPLYLSAVRQLTDKYNILLIADEVATGFGRTGKMFACEHAGITPDIMVLGKALTAGYIGHAATLVTSKIYDAFLGDDYKTALMHGPTFMANALACTVALKGIKIFEKNDYLSKVQKLESIIENQLINLKCDKIVEIRRIGAIMAIEFTDSQLLSGFGSFAEENGVWLRPIGNVLYIMPAYIIEEHEVEKIFQVIRLWISNLVV